jgi:WD40 repeat protein
MRTATPTSAALLMLAACGGGGGGASTALLSEKHAIDGVVDLDLMKDVQQATLTFNDVGGLPVKSTTLRWAVANDDRDLYFAFEWTDDTHDSEFDFSGPVDFDGVKLLFDNDGDGVHEVGEDRRMVFAASIGSIYQDQHFTSGDEADLIGDGLGKLSYDSVSLRYQAEMIFPLVADAEGEDANVTAATRVNIVLYDHAVVASSTGNLAKLVADDLVTTSWPAIPLKSVAEVAGPKIPEGLSGLVAFVSVHEDPVGEIYTFAPATGAVTRVTFDSLYEDNVSLSHDRTRIAFHATPDPDDPTAYEVYVIGVDGSGLTQLTDNAILDGHPGWSPDDSRIAYASFRDPKTSIVVMTAQGVELADLTPPQFDDNDPDWLQDGRIVFKTDRFSAIPQVRIAVMNDDGTGVQAVTSVAGVSDHDPVGSSDAAIFERFLKGTNYATDIEAAFTPWNLVEARLDGTKEKTLLGDGWINWLPVSDPSGQFVVHLKSVGYTEAALLTKKGKRLGRLIPGITRLRYIDWK